MLPPIAPQKKNPQVTYSISKRSLSRWYNDRKYMQNIQGSEKGGERKIHFLCVMSPGSQSTSVYEASGPSSVAKLLGMAG